MLDALSLDIIAPAFLAGILVLATHVPFGTMVLDRGIVFIDIAIAQVAALGVVIGSSIYGDLMGLPAQLSAFTAAIVTSLFLIWTDKRAGAMQEAVIGVVFVLASSLQLIVLSRNPGGAENLKELLVGQILLVTPRDLLFVFAAYAGILAVWAFRDLKRERVLFYMLFAVMITLSVQIVGVLLVFASLIVPALASRILNPKWRIIAAFNIGVLGYISGLILSALKDLPTGATVVCTIVAAALIASLVFRRLPAGIVQEPVLETGHGHAPAAEGEVIPLSRIEEEQGQPVEEGGSEPSPKRRSKVSGIANQR